MVDTTVMYVIHGLFGALWTGSVLFVAVAVLPVAVDGKLEPDAFGSLVGRLRWITRISALLLLVSGGHLAGTLYDANTLLGTGSGHLVLTMLGLWLGLAAVVEIGSARAARGIEAGKKREPARDAKPFYYAGAVFSVGLLLTAGLLGTARITGF